MSQHRSGPVRSAAARTAILTATAQLFHEKGYDHLTMEGIAQLAGVGKQTVYRWWPSKGAIIADCLLEGMILPDKITPPNTGDLRADLATWMGSIFAILEQPRGQDLLRSLIAAAAENPDVGRRLQQTLADEETFAGRLQEAIDSGELDPATPLKEVAEGLVGVLILRALTRDPLDAAATERLLGLIFGRAS